MGSDLYMLDRQYSEERGNLVPSLIAIMKYYQLHHPDMTIRGFMNKDEVRELVARIDGLKIT